MSTQAKEDEVLGEIIGQMAGAVSMCWEPKPSEQVFDSAQAKKYVDEAASQLQSLIDKQVMLGRIAELESCSRIYSETLATGSQVRVDLHDRAKQLKEQLKGG